MKRILCLFLLQLLITPALAGSPVPLWSTPALLQQPESVVWDPARGVLYVSNIDGGPGEKDGKGYISRLDLDGNILDLVWVKGLNAPKGLAVAGDRLYTADIDQLVEIDIPSGTVVQRYSAPGAVFLNDVTIDDAGNVYVSDMMTNRIHRLHAGRFEVWLESPELENPNGLLAENDRIVVGCWGPIVEGFRTEVPGRLKAVSLSDRSITLLGDGSPIGNLDGVEPDGEGGYTLTDWMAGALIRFHADGTVETLLDLPQGSADHEFIPEKKMVIIPMMNDAVVRAWKLGE